MGTTTQYLTAAYFRQLPEDHGHVYHEPRHDEPVAVTRPKFRHSLIQRAPSAAYWKTSLRLTAT